MTLRHQLAVHSPIPLAALARAAPGLLGRGDELAAAVAREVGAAFRAEAVTLCGSGTQALQLALGLAPEGPVALPAFCCYDVASAAVGADREVILYDLDPETLAPEVASLERAFLDGARAAVIAPLYGVPAPWEPLQELADRHGALLIEDAAQGHGAAWHGAPLGSLGRVSVLSFGRGKGWTGGGGGALLTRGAPAAAAALAGAGRGGGALAKSAAQWLLGRPALYGIPMAVPQLGLGETRYRPPVEPHAMPAAALALLRLTRDAAQHEAAERRRRAAEILERLPASHPPRPIRIGPGARPGYLRLPVLLPGGIDAFADPAAARRLGIMPGYPTTLEAVPALRERLRDRGRNWPGAERLVRELVTLPTHTRLTPAERRAIIAACYELSAGSR